MKKNICRLFLIVLTFCVFSISVFAGEWSESVAGHSGGKYLPKDIKDEVRSFPEIERARDKEDERQANRGLESMKKLIKYAEWLTDNAEKILGLTII